MRGNSLLPERTRIRALLTDRAVRLSTAKAYVISDSVLCMGRINENPVQAWKVKIGLVHGLIQMSRIGSNRRGADGVRVDYFLQILAEIQMTERPATVTQMTSIVEPPQ